MKFKQSVLFLVVSVVILFSTSFVQADQLGDMQDDLAMRLNFLQRYHKKHAKAIVNAAQDDVFKNYFLSTSDSEKKTIKSEIEQLSLVVQKKFKVDEMCLIDRTGQEVARIVFNKIAPDEDLSSEEDSAPFFNPSFAQKAKKVHIQPPYLSADSLRWVICYTTPIVLEDGSMPAFYHFEMPIYAIQDAINKGIERSEDNYVLLVNKDGSILSDSRKKFELEIKKEDGQSEGDALDAAVVEKYFPSLSDGDLSDISNDIKSGAGNSSFTSGGNAYLAVYGPAKKVGWSIVVVNKK